MFEWRHFLYYCLGLLPSLFFGLRFLIQWLQSEKRKSSYIDPSFWRFSLAGNLLLASHYFIQLQYPFMMLQVLNGFIAWRNLNFMQKKKPYSLNFSLFVLIGIFLLVTVGFSLQSNPLWLQLPAAIEGENVSLLWHVIGIFGASLFAARFWIQWWETERNGKSVLGTPFWILSIVGSLIALIYFIKTKDIISILNYSFGLIPYLRNLWLIKAQDRDKLTHP